MATARFLVPALIFVLLALACTSDAPPPTSPPDLTATTAAQTENIRLRVQATVASQPTSTPWPTYTPQLTFTPHPTLAPAPTATLRPTYTPYPTPTLRPTARPKPTYTPYPTYTPAPASVNPVVTDGRWIHLPYGEGGNAIYNMTGATRYGRDQDVPAILELACDHEGKLTWAVSRSSAWATPGEYPGDYSIDGQSPLSVTLIVIETLETFLFGPLEADAAIARAMISADRSVILRTNVLYLEWNMAGVKEAADAWLSDCMGQG